jgi:hypothetical protein
LIRLNQLQLQREGSVSFRRPEVIVRLRLSKQQSQAITDIPPEGFLSLASAAVKLKARTALAQILSPTQHEDWQNLIGEPFAFEDGDDVKRYVLLDFREDAPVDSAQCGSFGKRFEQPQIKHGWNTD